MFRAFVLLLVGFGIAGCKGPDSKVLRASGQTPVEGEVANLLNSSGLNSLYFGRVVYVLDRNPRIINSDDNEILACSLSSDTKTSCLDDVRSIPLDEAYKTSLHSLLLKKVDGVWYARYLDNYSSTTVSSSVVLSSIRSFLNS